jgi:integrase/recombinase XerD
LATYKTTTRQLTIKSGATASDFVPSVIAKTGNQNSKLYLEFFAARIRNKNTREAYLRNVNRFFIWCHERMISFERIEPMVIAAYIEELTNESPPETVKQHLAAIRKLYDHLVINQVLAVNPAASVRGPKVDTVEGKTPILTSEEARTLLDSIDTSDLRGQRDRAMIALMLYSFARVGAVVRMKVSDFYRHGDNWRVRLREKGSKSREIPVHPEAVTFIKSYLEISKLMGQDSPPLFQALRGNAKEVAGRALHRNDVLAMVKRRAKEAGLSSTTCCHTFRATGLTVYMENGGILQHAQRIAGHADPRTTQLYIRTGDDVAMSELKKIDF